MQFQVTIDQRDKVARMLWAQQRTDPGNVTLAHDVGLFHYWWAKALRQEGTLETAGDAWRQVIANWAMVLEDDGFWQDWCSHRSEVYATDISQHDVQTVRDQLEERLQAELADYSGHFRRQEPSDSASKEHLLDLVFELEMRAIQSLKRAGGFPTSDDESEKIMVGPLTLRRLGLSSTFGRFIVNLGPVGSKESEMLTRLLQMVMDDELDMSRFDSKARRQLMRYFSQLGIPAVYLDRSQPQQALTALRTRCHHEVAVQSDGGSRAHAEQLPCVCRDSCPQFAECNPAYAALDNGDQTLFEHAVELTIEAHMRAAELCIAAEQVDVQQASAEWQQAVALAEEIDKAKKTLSDIIEMIVGRTVALEKGKRIDKAIELLDATADLYENDRLVGKLAELLTDRGVRAGNEERWGDAVRDLRRAYQLNRRVPRTRDNYIIALRGSATHCHSEDEHDRARELLEEAVRVLKGETAEDRGNPHLREQLSQVQRELAIVSSAGEGLLGVLSGLLASAMGEDAVEDEEAPSRSLEFRGAMLVAQGQFAEAERLLKRAVAASPRRKRPLIALSKLYAQTKNVRGVVEMQQRIAEIDPTERFNAQINIGRVLQKVDDHDGALECYRRAAALADSARQKSQAYELSGDVLILEERFDEAEAALTRALGLNPANRGAQLSQRTLQLARAPHRPTSAARSDMLSHLLETLALAAEETREREEPKPRQTPDVEQKKREGRPGFLGRLLGRGRHEAAEEEKKDVPRVRRESSLDIVQRYLDETGLKHRHPARNTFVLPFDGNTVDTIMPQLKVIDDMAIIAVLLPRVRGIEGRILYNMLRATYTADIYKLCQDSDGDLSIAAEVPVSVLDAETLERLIRNAVDLVDLVPPALGDFNRVMTQVKQLQMRANLKTMLASRQAGGQGAHVLIPSFARRLGIRCQRRRETRFLLIFGEMDLRVVASCTGQAVSFIAAMSGMRPHQGNLSYYRRMAKMNIQMNVCKVALDSDDDVTFMYELPGLNEKTFEQMVERMDAYVMRFGMELTLLA